MRVLTNVPPTPEQLLVIRDHRPGTMLIRGAAGSGKTSTAVLRLKFLTRFWQRRQKEGYVQGPIRILVLTYNRTLRGYIEELVRNQIPRIGVELELSTFGRWSLQLLNVEMVDSPSQTIRPLARNLPLEGPFVVDEVEYVLGRFLPEKLHEYLSVERRGRGTTPRMDRATRNMLLTEVVEPYRDWKASRGLSDWNDLAVILAGTRRVAPYHVVIVDEAQDFSANQIRAVHNHLAEEHSVTYVLDAVQRIYPREFTWKEAGVEIDSSVRLSGNFRNTKEIAAFAYPLVKDLPRTDDGTLPNFSESVRHGPLPVVLRARFSRQLDYVIEAIQQRVGTGQSFAILHSKGGGWFKEVRRRLLLGRIGFVGLTRRSDWPQGTEVVALSTMHSAKGLEFDHVFIPGLNSEVTPAGIEEDDTDLQNYRRLLAMAIGRARETVMVGYKAEEASPLVRYLDSSTYEARDL